MNKTPHLYIFGWPGAVGGASTKLAHLLPLLAGHLAMVVVPNQSGEVDEHWTNILDRLGVSWCLFEDLPQHLDGWGISLCNFEFLLSPRWAEVRARGLKMAWSNEMMWTHPGELGAIFTGLVDQVLYVSEVQRDSLEPQYYAAWTGSLSPWRPEHRTSVYSGELRSPSAPKRLRWTLTSNYIDPDLFPARVSRLKSDREPLVIGRLSRPDPDKFPSDFPHSYENLGVKNPRFRVMAWNAEVSERWKGHTFDSRWELLPVLAEEPSAFLRSLDLFVYSLGPNVRESWGRSVVEAMLSGAVPIIPAGKEHHLHHLVRHGQSGFHCHNEGEFGQYARLLDNDRNLLLRCSEQARADALNRWCVKQVHWDYWAAAFPELWRAASHRTNRIPPAQPDLNATVHDSAAGDC